VASVGNKLQAGRFLFPVGTKLFLCLKTSRPILGPTQSPILWVSRSLSLRGIRGTTSPPARGHVACKGTTLTLHIAVEQYPYVVISRTLSEVTNFT